MQETSKAGCVLKHSAAADTFWTIHSFMLGLPCSTSMDKMYGGFLGVYINDANVDSLTSFYIRLSDKAAFKYSL